MKKSAFIFKTITFIFMALLILQVKPQITYALTSGDYEYEVIGGTATITGYNHYTYGLPNDAIIPATIDGYKVTSIGNNAFSTKGLTSVVIPDGVISIGDNAFRSNSSLKSVNIPNSVTSIGSQAFSYNDLTNVIIPNSVTKIGYSAFSDSTSLTEVVIPNSVISIGDVAFYGSSKLISVTIPNSVTSIGDGAFSKCESLTRIDVGTGNATYSSMDGVLYNKSKTTLMLYPPSKADLSFTVPNSVTSIGGGAFQYCSNLKSIIIPNNVTIIGESAFHLSSSLTNVSIGNGVTSIGDYAFNENKSLNKIDVDINNKTYSSVDGVLYNKSKTTLMVYPPSKADLSFTVPNSVTEIASSAFSSTSKLVSVSIPNSVTSIGGGAFGHSSSLASVNIPDSVTYLGAGAFLAASNLTNITLGNNITEINNNMFAHCTKLTNITIPSSVSFIDYAAFYNVQGLTKVTFLGNAPTMISADEGGLFDTSIANFKIYYLSGKTGFTNPWNGYPTEAIKPVVYTVIYNGNGNNSGKAPTDSKTYLANQIVTLLGNTGFLAKTGYTFVGWNTKADGSGTNYSVGSTLIMGESNINLYAKWIVNPTIPTNVQASSAGYNSINTSWGAVAGVTGYEIYRSTSSSGTYSKAGETTSATFTNTGLTAGTTYYYKVRAYTTLGTTKVYSNYSAVVSAKPVLLGWVKDSSGRWYYYKTVGSLSKGWLLISNQWYYFDTTGTMTTGWKLIGTKWYYFNTNGTMVKGWIQLGTKWYYLDSSGAMKTGWVLLSGKWYYFDASGVWTK